jgi:hypothetical protein
VSLLTPRALTEFREGDEPAWTLAAFAVGLVAVFVAMAVPAVPPATGLVVGGVLVGLVARSQVRALTLGCYFGGTVLVAWALGLVLFGVFGPVAGAWPLSALAVALGIGVPALAAVAVRGLI